jgi:four helix bundle protein
MLCISQGRQKNEIQNNMRIKICRKEAKESPYWLRLIDTYDESEQEKERKYLVEEATELMNIFGAILAKSK